LENAIFIVEVSANAAPDNSVVAVNDNANIFRRGGEVKVVIMASSRDWSSGTAGNLLVQQQGAFLFRNFCA